MRNRFYSSAVAAAKESPEAFSTLFENKESNVNVKVYGHFGNPLIIELIMQIPDTQLPAILKILIQRHVDLECRDSCDETPLATAARYGKINAIHTLIENKANINDPIKPPLCAAIDSHLSDLLPIIKILVQHGAHINIQDRYSLSPLHHAAQSGNLEILQYLLSQGANLFLKYSYTGGTRNETVIGTAHKEYISARKCSKESHPYVVKVKNILKVLLKAAKDFLYHQGILFEERNKEETLKSYLSQYIHDLAGNFGDIIYGKDSNSQVLRDLLEKEVLFPVVKQIEEEQRHAFCMGSRLSHAQQESQSKTPAIYRFYQRSNGRDLINLIFSYAHELTPRTKTSTDPNTGLKK